MTLVVSPYTHNAKGEIQWVAVPPDYSDLAGIESSRQSFWGSEEVKQLGLTLVITLAHSDIYAEGATLFQLTQEIETLIEYVSGLSQREHTSTDKNDSEKSSHEKNSREESNKHSTY